MKNIFFALTFICCVLLFSCRPDAYKEIGQPLNKLQALSGNWKLVQVTQTDLVAERYGYQDPSRPDVSLTSMDVTNVAPFSNFNMALTLGNSTAGTFTTTPGTAPKIIKFAAGTLNVDNVDVPSKLSFINGTDTVKMDIGNYTALANNALVLSLTRYQGNKAVLRYDYKFSKN